MNAETLALIGDLACLVYVLWRRRKLPTGRSFPLISGLLIAHLILFGAPAVLFRGGLLRIVTAHGLARASGLVTLGLLAMLAGYESPLTRLAVAPMPVLLVRWRGSPRRRLLGWLVIGLLALTLQKIGQSPVIDGLLTVTAFAGLWAMASLWLIYWRGEIDSLAVRSLLFTLTAALFGLELVQGELARPVLDGALLYTVYLRGRGRIPWLAMVVGLPLMVALIGAKTAFRAALPGGAWERASLSEKLAMYPQALRLALKVPQAPGFASHLLLRLSDVGLLAIVVDQTPRFVPYWDGRTYADLAWKFVPRILDRNKPLERTGSAFGHRYGVLAPTDRITSVNLPMLIEGYANFGVAGTVLEMLLLGVICRVLKEFFSRAQFEDAIFCVAAPVMASLFMIEDTLANTVGAFAQHSVFLLLVIELSGICAVRLGPPAGWGRQAVLVEVHA